MRRYLALLFALVIGFAVRPGSAQAPKPPAGQRVFVTAHSFHIFVAARLAPLAKAAGIADHTLVGAQMIGGSKVIQHWDLPDEKNQAKRALSAGGVDVLTMSPIMTYTPDDGIDHYVELGAKNNPKMRCLIQQSWPGYDGWLPGERVATNEERDTRSLDIVRTANRRFRVALEAQAAELNKKLGRQSVYIVPAGDAVQKLRELLAAGKAPGLTKQTDLFADPIGHGKEPVVALTTYCNFACIYGISPVGINLKNPTLDNLSPDLDPLLRKIAWETVTGYPQSGVK